MLKSRHYILILLTLILTCFSFDSTSGKADFEIKVETFLKDLESDFEVSPERMINEENNDWTLETKVNSTWSKTVTLKSKKAFRNHYGQSVKQRLYMGFHYFDTAEGCEEAFDNVMGCLGTDCQKITWGDESTSLHTTPFVYIKTEKQILFCKISCEHKNTYWTDFNKRLEEEFKTEIFKIISTDCGGNLSFKKSNE
jgi:hypothetical protein